MRIMVVVAILLVALGIIALAYQGITYTTRGRSVDLGPLHMATENSHFIPLPPILGAIALIGGIVLLVVNSKRANHALSR